MKPALACGLAALIGLSACSGVSSGVRSPCFEPGSQVVTRGFAFVAGPLGEPAEIDAPAPGQGGADGCDFRDF